MSPSAPAKPPRRSRVREALVRAGIALFAEHPVDAVPIDDIVGEADVAKGSFYKHFADKDAFLAALVKDIRDRIERRVHQVNGTETDPARRVVRGICVYLRHAVDHPQEGGVLLRNNGIGQTLPLADFNRGVLGDVDEGLASGRFEAPSVESGMLMVMGVAQAALARFNDDRGHPDNLQIAHDMCLLLLCGLGLGRDEANRIASDAAADLLQAAASACAS